jgi:hypothetical protein
MSTQNIKARSANKIIITIDGKTIGGIRECTANDSYSREGLYGIGDINPYENVPTAARYQLSVSGVAFYTNNMRQAGIVGENGEDMLRGMVFDIAFLDKDSGDVLRKYTGCSHDSGSVSVQANRVIIQSGQFIALDAQGTAV